MNRYPTVAVMLFLAAGCEHSRPLDTPATPKSAETAPAPVPETAAAPAAPAEPGPVAAPGASAAPSVPAVTDGATIKAPKNPWIATRASPQWADRDERARIKTRVTDAAAAPADAPAAPASPAK